MSYFQEDEVGGNELDLLNFFRQSVLRSCTTRGSLGDFSVAGSSVIFGSFAFPTAVCLISTYITFGNVH